MTENQTTHDPATKPFDWNEYLASYPEVGKYFEGHYRVVPLALPLRTEDMDGVHHGYEAMSQGEQSFVFDDNMLVKYPWSDGCDYVVRLERNGRDYLIREAILNEHPEFGHDWDASSEVEAGWVLADIDSLAGHGYFEWRGDDPEDGWLWHFPPKRVSHKIRRIGKQPGSIRPRIQRAMLAWFGEERFGPLRVPLRLGNRTDHYLSVSFGGFVPELVARLTQNKLQVTMVWQGKPLPCVASFEAVPLLTADGVYVCSQCGEFEFYRSREMLWCSRLFNPFFQWIQDELATAQWLVIDRSESAPSVRLATECPAPRRDVTVLPLRNDPPAQ